MLQLKTVTDVRNEFLSRREIVCDFEGASGTLKKLDAVDAVTREHSLEGKFIVPVRMQNHVGKKHTTGTFFVYDDESLAKKHIDSSILDRIDKAKKAQEEAAKAEAAPAEGADADSSDNKETASGESETKAKPAEAEGKTDAEPDKAEIKADAEPDKVETKADAEPAQTGDAKPEGAE